MNCSPREKLEIQGIWDLIVAHPHEKILMMSLPLLNLNSPKPNPELQMLTQIEAHQSWWKMQILCPVLQFLRLLRHPNAATSPASKLTKTQV